MAGALCQVCTSLQPDLHQSHVAGGLAEPCQATLIRLRWHCAEMRRPRGIDMVVEPKGAPRPSEPRANLRAPH
jgi:hypothetical protein